MGIIRTVERSTNSAVNGFRLRSSGLAKRSTTTPEFINWNATVGSTGAQNIAYPNNTRKGDLLIAAIETSGADTTITVSPWVHVQGSPIVNVADATGTKLNVMWRVAEEDAGTAIMAIPDAGDHTVAIMCAYRNVRTDVAPGRISATSTSTTPDTALSFPAITTPYDNCRVVQITSIPDDTTTTCHPATLTNANFDSGATERWERGTTSGDGGLIAFYDGAKAVAGSTGNSTGTRSLSTTNVMITFALEPVLALPA